MRTRSSWIWCWVIGAVLASGAGAQQYATIIDNLPTCTGNRNGRVISVSDAVSDTDCTVGGATGTDRFVHQCICDTLNALGPYWKAVGGGGEVDLSGYVKLAGDEDGQTIQGVTGVTNEVSRVVLDASQAQLGGPLVGTAYGYVTASGDGVVVFFTNGDTISGQLYSTTDGTGISTWNGFTVAAGDGLSVSTTKDEVVAEFMAKNALTVKSGLRIVASEANGANGRAQLYVDGNQAFEASTLRTTIQHCSDYGPLYDYSSIGTPIECDRFYDLTLHVPCFYNGTDWKSVIDGTTTCTATTP